MDRTSVFKTAQSMVKVAQYFDKEGLYAQADNILTFIKMSQNATQALLNDTPGGFYLQNLNNTAYGLKNNMGGYPGSGHSYWDANGGETARNVDLRNYMMGQGGMSAEDLQKFTLWQRDHPDQATQQWQKGEIAQIQRDMQMMQQRLQDPSLTPEEKTAFQTAINAYAGTLAQMQQANTLNTTQTQ